MITDMKTKIKNIMTLALPVSGLCLAATTTSCDDFTDIQPKGENLLASTNDLELLLNTDAYDGIYSMDDFLRHRQQHHLQLRKRATVAGCRQ